MGSLADAIGTQENHLTLANKHNQLSSRIQALASLGRLHFNLGQVDASVSYLEQALAATEGTDEREDEAIIRYRLVERKKNMQRIICFNFWPLNKTKALK